MITTQTPAELLAQADAIADRIKVLTAEFAELVEAAQDACSHPISSIRESPWQENYYTPSVPSFRVCIECGLREDNSYMVGFQTLGDNTSRGIASLPRREALKLERSKRP